MRPRALSSYLSGACLALLPLVMHAQDSSTPTCLTYSDKDITLRGKLSRHTFAEQPNYESIAKGDAKATYFFLSPKAPLCVAKGNEVTEEAVDRLMRVQLIFPEPDPRNSYEALRVYLGKEVTCRGSLFPAISGHHHPPVLLAEARCEAAIE